MLADLFLQSALKRFREYKTLGEKTFAQLEENDMLFTPNESSNSIAVIIQHMHGNMLSRWTNFLTEDGEKEWRRRDEEFESRQGTKKELIQLWDEGWAALFSALENLEATDLTRTITIRSQPLTVVDAINRQFAHYSYHVGQIVYLGRWIRNNEWTSLSIPKGGSDAYNEKLTK
jgi:uncharacterized damage-inducible protein DinB